MQPSHELESPLAPARLATDTIVKWARRALTIPGLLLLFAIDVALLPILLAGALVVDVARGRGLVMVRFQLALAIALALHVHGVLLLAVAWVLGGRWAGATNDREGSLDARVEVWLARLAWGAATWVYGMRLEIEGADALAGEGPIVFLSRHASLLDPLLPAFLIGRAERHLSLRYVIKRELTWDPCVDLIGHRIPNGFVRRGQHDTAGAVARIGALARGLGSSDAIVIFPEGTRFSARKRAEILLSLARTNPSAFDRGIGLRHVLPPHTAGALAVLDAAEPIDVVFCAHTGLEDASHFSDLARGELIGKTVRVRMWRVPAERVPWGRDERVTWLQGWWRTIDDWIEQQSTSAPGRPPLHATPGS